MKILFTGVSSFTGHWFVRELATLDHEIVCPLTGSHTRYDEIRLARMRKLPESVRMIENAAFGTDRFRSLMQDFKPEAICHHGADVRDYRSADFDPFAAVRENSLNVGLILREFAALGGEAIILTGSIFEAGEGQGELPRRAFSPYGLSKTLTSSVFEYYAHENGLSFGKFVIPNPFGPMEEPRFTAYLMKTWKLGKSASVKTPEYIRDNIPVDLLALVYRRFVENLLKNGVTGASFMRPSGYVESQGTFAERVSREVTKRTGWECRVALEQQTCFSEPRIRFNDSPALQISKCWSEILFWDQFAEYYLA